MARASGGASGFSSMQSEELQSRKTIYGGQRLPGTRKVEVTTWEPAAEAPVSDDHNPNSPEMAKFLIGLVPTHRKDVRIRAFLLGERETQ